jgi:hypothetical protein
VRSQTLSGYSSSTGWTTSLSATETNPITSLIASNVNTSIELPCKGQAPEPMAIDQVSTPVLHLPNIDVGLVNTRLVFFFQFTFIFTQFPIEQQSRKINNHFSFYTVLRCRAFLRFITHNISNLTPEDQMIAYMPSSTLAPTRARQRPFRLRSVFNAGHTLSPMSPKYVIFSLFVIRSAAA